LFFEDLLACVDVSAVGYLLIIVSALVDALAALVVRREEF
jgi:hypothetical protein